MTKIIRLSAMMTMTMLMMLLLTMMTMIKVQSGFFKRHRPRHFPSRPQPWHREAILICIFPPFGSNLLMMAMMMMILPLLVLLMMMLTTMITLDP